MRIINNKKIMLSVNLMARNVDLFRSFRYFTRRGKLQDPKPSEALLREVMRSPSFFWRDVMRDGGG
jgi:hypothetical protein